MSHLMSQNVYLLKAKNKFLLGSFKRQKKLIKAERKSH